MKYRVYDKLNLAYSEKKVLIKASLEEFKNTFENGDDVKIFEELVFCIFTAGASAKMGFKALNATRDILMDGSFEELSNNLQHFHRFPNSRARYIVHTREYLKKEFGFRLKDLILSHNNPLERRDFIACHKGFKGLGYKEASHFLRNIGFSGYAILDKHILRSLNEFGVIDSSKPPQTRDKYLEVEDKLKDFAFRMEIDFNELDLLLWSEKTGEILK